MSTTVNKSFLQALSEMDATDIQYVEDIMTPMDVENVEDRIKSVKGRFFSVDFARKRDKKVGGVVVEPAGSLRHMVCRTGVAKYVQGNSNRSRATEDSKNEVLTVWDVGVYQQLRDEGIAQEVAGQRAYRRINMADVRAISIAPVVEVETATEQERVAVADEVVETV